MITPPRERFASIQAFRGVAACMVAAMHCVSAKGGLNHPTDPAFFLVTRVLCTVGGAGVDIFFVISGFIIMTIADRPTPAARTDIARKFLLRRALRIYPLFWITLAVMLLEMWSAGVRGQDLYHLVKWQVWLLTRASIAILPPAWSLVFEVWFYACVSALLLLPQRHFRIAIAAWASVQMVLMACHLWGGRWPHQAVLVRPQVLEFFFGCAVSCLTRWRAAGPRLATICLAASACLFATGSLRCYNRLPAGSLVDAERLLFFGGPATLAVLALVSLEQQGIPSAPAWLRRLGDCSYSLYLWHFPLMSAAFLLFPIGPPHIWPSLPRAALEFAATLIVANWSYRFIERPTIRLGHHLTSGGLVHEATA